MFRNFANFIILGLSLAFLFPPSVLAFSDVHITKDGSVSVLGAKVMQIAGPTFFTRLYWGDAFVRLTVKGLNTTKVLRATGELTTYSEIKEGDLLDMLGSLESGGDTLTLIPKQIMNSSVQKKQAVISGKVAGIDLSASHFTLETKDRGLVAVVSTSTTKFLKGSRIIDLKRLKINDKITKVIGDLDLKTNSILASSITIYFDLETLKPKIYQGTLNSISGTTLPTNLVLAVGINKYKVELNGASSVLNKDRLNIGLSRFEVGDKIRVYGTLREEDDLVIDAEVIRNVSI